MKFLSCFVLFMSLLISSCSMRENQRSDIEDGSNLSQKKDSGQDDDELTGSFEEPTKKIVQEKATDQNDQDELMSTNDDLEKSNKVVTTVVEHKKQRIKKQKHYSVNETDFDMSQKSTYAVEENNETLMWISFKLFGDYRKWKELSHWNGEGILSRKFKVGDTLIYHPLKNPFHWTPKGTPYLIQYGDYLGRISKKVYGTTKKWPVIFENNYPMIRDPDLIFAGFTLYYP